MKVSFSSGFKRLLRKKLQGRPELEVTFRERLERFIENPFEPSLKTHKLSGKLKSYWGFSIEYDLRVVFSFEAADEALFIAIATHDEVY